MGGQVLTERSVGPGATRIASQAIETALTARHGLTAVEARARLWLVDEHGLGALGDPHRPPPRPEQAPYWRASAPAWARHADGTAAPLAALVEHIRPSVLIGVSGQYGLFTPPVLRAVAAHHERPVIFALSNPDDHAECTALTAYAATDGRAIFASGGPSLPVSVPGGASGRAASAVPSHADAAAARHPAQVNNAFIFPAVSRAVASGRVHQITDRMLLAGAEALAALVTAEDLAVGRVLPPVQALAQAIGAVATALIDAAGADGPADPADPAALKIEL